MSFSENVTWSFQEMSRIGLIPLWIMQVFKEHIVSPKNKNKVF